MHRACLMACLMATDLLLLVLGCDPGERTQANPLVHGNAGVLEASVIGQPHPDWGEEVVAFVVARPGTAVAADELDRLCLDHIARYKRPRRYRFVDSLPKNNYGKVLKTELRAALSREDP